MAAHDAMEAVMLKGNDSILRLEQFEDLVRLEESLDYSRLAGAITTVARPGVGVLCAWVHARETAVQCNVFALRVWMPASSRQTVTFGLWRLKPDRDTV